MNIHNYHHRQWWCHQQMFYRFKHFNNLLNISSLFITSLGLVIGPVLQNAILTATLTATGMFIKGWNDFKKYSIKMDMSKFAYSTHAKAITELRTFTDGSPMDSFLLKQQTLEEVIIDFAPPISPHILKKYKYTFSDQPDGQNPYKQPTNNPTSITFQTCGDNEEG